LQAKVRCASVRCVAGLLALVCASRLQAEPATNLYDQTWHFLVKPYLWTPRIDGTLNFTTASGSKPEVSITPIDYLDNLNVPLMLTGEVRRGPWSILTDLVYVEFSGEKAKVETIQGPGGLVEIPIDLGTTVGLRGTVWTLGGEYTAFHGEYGAFGIVAGFRYFHVKTSLDWNLAGGLQLMPPTGSVSQSDDLWMGVLGVRGRVQFGDSHWFAPYYADVGSGECDLTWLASGGLGYTFGWLDMLLIYRDLVFDDGDLGYIEQLHLTGPALGVGFRF